MAEERKLITKKKIGKLTISAQGLRHMAKFIKKKYGDGDVILEHFIAIYEGGLKTLGVDL